MKALLAILVIILAILAFVLTRPVKNGGMYKNSPKTTEQQQEVPASQPQTPPQEKPSKAGQMAEEVNSVIDYGTGATAVKAKKNALQKLQGIQQKHSANQARELGE